jgi:sterol desaturase/sphingolipid hydroxylase (fatty acid hydroxylase superfamily)
MPRDHAWHHADADEHGNFGANFTLWDRLHGTYLQRTQAPVKLGIPTKLPLWRALFWPFA